jgi:hypothetical protein
MQRPRDRSQGKAGRLDLLLSNPDEDVRYEVELMLGPTDPSHIIRTIEYWDIERRRYPAYEHVAVLVAEDVTARFLNVLALLSGSIPLIAIQLNALQVGENIVLDFVRVLDQTELRVDEVEEAAAKAPVDRGHWERRASAEAIGLMDQLFARVRAQVPNQQLNYNQQFVGLTDGRRSRNFLCSSLRRVICASKRGWARRRSGLRGWRTPGCRRRPSRIGCRFTSRRSCSRCIGRWWRSWCSTRRPRPRGSGERRDYRHRHRRRHRGEEARLGP